MRRKNVFTLIIVMMLLSLCTACAEDVLSSGGEKEEISDISDTSDAQDVDEDTPSAQSAFTIERTERVSPVKIDFYTEEQSTKTEDDTVVCVKKCIYPVVAIEGNKNAADKINADIQERVDSFRLDTLALDMAAQDYEIISENNTEYHFHYYTDESIFTAARADSKVISFLVTSQYYVGGPHGMDTYIGLNYDTQTGELIDFTDLSENTDAFGQDTIIFIQSLAATDTYQGIMWGDVVDELQEVLYQEKRWYLSTSGLVFFSNPYELGAFVSGKIEFAIPYSVLEEIGMKEKYDYEGTGTIRLQTEEVYVSDLNGDGQDEKIQFYIDSMGRADTDVHFLIDGIDYGMEHEELSGQFADDNYIFCWIKCFLYDMDPADAMIEIAFQMNYTSWKDDIVTPYTFLYRYEGEGILTYLGRIEGTITDPTAVFCIRPQNSAADER